MGTPRPETKFFFVSPGAGGVPIDDTTLVSLKRLV